MIKRSLQAIGASLILIGIVMAARALTPGQNTVVVLPFGNESLTITNPQSGATVAGTIQITGLAGSQWATVAAFDASNNYVKVATDVATSGRAYVLTLPTGAMTNGTHVLSVEAFSPIVGGAFTDTYLPLTIVVNNSGAPTIQVNPSIAGIAQVGTPLTLTQGTWTNSPTSITDQWQINGATNGATGLNYTPVTGDAGKLVSALETATNAIGSATATSGTVGPVAPSGTAGNAVAANDFLNSVGIGAVPSADVNQINYLGARWVRGTGYDGGQTLAGIQADIAAAQANHWKLAVLVGSTFGCNCGVNCSNNHSVPDVVAVARLAANAGVLLAVEGPNEPGNWPVCWPTNTNNQYGNTAGSDWYGVLQMQAELYREVKADPVVKNYPVWSMSHAGSEIGNYGSQCLRLDSSCAGASTVTLNPPGSVFADAANVHNYVICTGCTYVPVNNQAWDAADPQFTHPEAQENFPQDFISTWYQMELTGTGYAGYSIAQGPGVPKVTTETGWAMQDATSNAIGAKIMLSVYLAQYKRGYSYTSPFVAANAGDVFSWFNSDGSAKPVAVYTHNLTTILADTVEFTTGTLNYSIPSEPATVHDLLLKKSNGHFDLIVWSEQCPSGASAGANCTQPPPLQNTLVNLGGSHNVLTYDPTQGTGPVAPCATTCTGVSSVTLPLTDHPYIIETTS